MNDLRARLGPNDVPIFKRAFSDCAVASLVVRVDIWFESSVIVFVNSATNVLSDCVAVARFASARVWYCYILVNSIHI